LYTTRLPTPASSYSPQDYVRAQPTSEKTRITPDSKQLNSPLSSPCPSLGSITSSTSSSQSESWPLASACRLVGLTGKINHRFPWTRYFDQIFPRSREAELLATKASANPNIIFGEASYIRWLSYTTPVGAYKQEWLSENEGMIRSEINRFRDWRTSRVNSLIVHVNIALKDGSFSLLSTSATNVQFHSANTTGVSCGRPGCEGWHEIPEIMILRDCEPSTIGYPIDLSGKWDVAAFRYGSQFDHPWLLVSLRRTALMDIPS